MYTLSKKNFDDFAENFSLSPEELENALKRKISKNQLLQKRWFSLKANETLDGLSQIVLFTKKTQKSLSENRKVFFQIEGIILKLRWGIFDEGGRRVVEVIRKYLKWVKKFLSKIDIQGMDFYNTLFASTLIAIVQEVDTIQVSAH